ncbi:Repressor protein CI [Enterobacteriaceae bacterium RIT714]|nr:Repressor protein CI [Enterobacteriaceae bacterium RIT714]
MSNNKNTFRHISDVLKTSVLQNRGGQKVIQRIVDAYGFTSRQALCKHLGVSQSTMANRYARDTFPADWVVICSIETGVSIEWLAIGNENESFLTVSDNECSIKVKSDQVSNNSYSLKKFPIETFKNPNQGGQAAIERLVEAYGFKTRQALADHLQISKSTLANRYLRDTFPSDWIIRCALETGVSLLWLATGNDSQHHDNSSSIVHLKNEKIVDDLLIDGGYIALDRFLLSPNMKKPIAITVESKTYIAETAYGDISDGYWLIDIEGKISLRNLTRIPIGKVKVVSPTTNFICDIDDIKAIAKCYSVFNKHI